MKISKTESLIDRNKSSQAQNHLALKSSLSILRSHFYANKNQKVIENQYFENFLTAKYKYVFHFE